MLKFFFKTCPKSGRIRGIRQDTMFHKLLYPLLGFIALLWVIFRVVPKPSRATYPCQEVAIPVATSFIAWLLATTVGLFCIRIAKKYFSNRKVLVATLLAVSGVLLFVGAQLFYNTDRSFAANLSVVNTLPDQPNKPIGIAKGIFPGRVTWMRDTSATPWDGKGLWWTDMAINQKAVDNMMAQSIKSLTGEKSEEKAWKAVFKYFNKSHGRKQMTYDKSESIVIKINLNNSFEQNDPKNNQANASSQTILALLKQLVEKAGVPQDKITLIDAIRVIPDRIYNPCHQAFPDVHWVDGKGTNGRIKNEWCLNAFKYAVKNEGTPDVPMCMHEATYVINMPLLKGHEFSGVTLAAKNQYGSIANRDHTKYLKTWLASKPQFSTLVDLMATKELDGKTMLFIMDALFANVSNVLDNNKEYCAFNHLFNGQWCASIMMSFDGVAFDSVGLDFLVAEFGEQLGRISSTDTRTPMNHCDWYLHEAALIGNPPSGIEYSPDGVKLNSLGVHEHWNNAQDKLYSRNLKTGNGIELYKILPTIK